MNAAERELAGLVGRAWEIAARGCWSSLSSGARAGGQNPGSLPSREYLAAVNAVVDWWDARHVRWLEVLEQQRAERRLAFLAELDELERDIQARLRASQDAA